MELSASNFRKISIFATYAVASHWGARSEHNSVLLLAARFQGAEEIAYFELNTEEKVEMILMQSVTIIITKQQNLNIFEAFIQVLKSG